MGRPEKAVNIFDIEKGPRVNRLKKLFKRINNLTLDKWHGKLTITMNGGTIVDVKKEEHLKDITDI